MPEDVAVENAQLKHAPGLILVVAVVLRDEAMTPVSDWSASQTSKRDACASKSIVSARQERPAKTKPAAITMVRVVTGLRPPDPCRRRGSSEVYFSRDPAGLRVAYS